MEVEIVGLSEAQEIRRFVDLPRIFGLLSRERVFLPTLGTLAENVVQV